VFHDLLGITTGRVPKFVKRYGEVHRAMVEGVGRFTADVRSHRFPEAGHVYGIEPAELADFREYLDSESLSAPGSWDWEPLS
jgi:hypothetical protein